MSLQFTQSEAVTMQGQIAALQAAVDAFKANVDAVASGGSASPLYILQQANEVFQRAYDCAKAQTWFTAT